MKNSEDDNGRITDEQEIMEIIKRLPPEYIRKVKIYAGTLEEIFRTKAEAK